MALCLLLPPDPRLATAAKIAGKSGKTLMFASCCDIVPTSDVPQRSHFVSGSDTPIGGRNHTIPNQTILNYTKPYQTIPNHTNAMVWHSHRRQRAERGIWGTTGSGGRSSQLMASGWDGGRGDARCKHYYHAPNTPTAAILKPQFLLQN